MDEQGNLAAGAGRKAGQKRARKYGGRRVRESVSPGKS